MADCLKLAPDHHPYRQSKLTIDKTTGQASGSFADTLLPVPGCDVLGHDAIAGDDSLFASP